MDEKTFLVKQEQYRDRLREAELYRLVLPRRDGCPKRHQFDRRALAWFAHRLLGWEARLRKRPVESPVFGAWVAKNADDPCL
jgi:hypothetical protein